VSRYTGTGQLSQMWNQAGGLTQPQYASASQNYSCTRQINTSPRVKTMRSKNQGNQLTTHVTVFCEGPDTQHQRVVCCRPDPSVTTPRTLPPSGSTSACIQSATGQRGNTCVHTCVALRNQLRTPSHSAPAHFSFANLHAGNTATALLMPCCVVLVAWSTHA
jgi:hypothetical protein